MPTKTQILENMHEDTKAPKRFKCSKCGINIGAHNEYCHDGMCDDCFFETYFPEECKKPGS